MYFTLVRLHMPSLLNRAANTVARPLSRMIISQTVDKTAGDSVSRLALSALGFDAESFTRNCEALKPFRGVSNYLAQRENRSVNTL